MPASPPRATSLRAEAGTPALAPEPAKRAPEPANLVSEPAKLVPHRQRLDAPLKTTDDPWRDLHPARVWPD